MSNFQLPSDRSIEGILSWARKGEQEIIDRERPEILKGDISQAEQDFHDRRLREFKRQNPDFCRRMGVPIPGPESD